MLVDECCESDPETEVKPEDFYKAFGGWYEENHKMDSDDTVPVTPNMFGPNLTELHRITSSNVTRGAESVKVYKGLRTKKGQAENV